MEEEKVVRNKKRVLVQYSLLALILIVLPVGALFYMREGANYRRGVLEELKSFKGQQVILSPQKTADGEPIDPMRFKSRIMGVGFSSAANASHTEIMGTAFKKLQDQFHDNPELALVWYITDVEADQMRTLATTYNMSDTTQCFILQVPAREMELMTRRGFGWDLDKPSFLQQPFLVLADTVHATRYLYNPAVPREVEKMAEHIAVIMPKKRDKELVFKREEEK